MENSGPKPQSPEDNSPKDSETSDKNKSKKSENRALDIWQKFFRSEQELSKDETQESDDDEESESPVVKVWKSLGRIMRRGFAAEQTDTTLEKSVSNDDEFTKYHNVDTPADSELSEQIIVDEEEVYSPENYLDPQPETTVNEINNILRNLREIPSTTDEKNDIRTEQIPENTSAEESTIPEPIIEITNNNFAEPNPGINAVEKIQAQANIKSEKVTERVIERGLGGALPTLLVGAEYFARKRADKRLDKKITTSRDQVDNLRIEQNRASNNIQELRSGHQRVEDEILNIKEQAKNNLAKSTRINGSGISFTNTELETRQVRGQEIKKELAQENIRSSTPEIKPIIADNKNVISPEKIAERVFQAAERGEAIEKQYELRQEIKGNDFSTKSSNTNPLFGSINSNSTTSDITTKYQPKESPNIVFKNDQNNSPYTQAVKNGFLGALVIVVFAVLAYLFYRSIS